MPIARNSWRVQALSDIKFSKAIFTVPPFILNSTVLNLENLRVVTIFSSKNHRCH